MKPSVQFLEYSKCRINVTYYYDHYRAITYYINI